MQTDRMWYFWHGNHRVEFQVRVRVSNPNAMTSLIPSSVGDVADANFIIPSVFPAAGAGIAAFRFW